jgi:uncharacterized membrane protein
VRLPVGLCTALFAPGYILVTLLFSDGPARHEGVWISASPSWYERLFLSCLLSIISLILLSLGLAFESSPIGLTPTNLGVAVALLLVSGFLLILVREYHYGDSLDNEKFSSLIETDNSPWPELEVRMFSKRSAGLSLLLVISVGLLIMLVLAGVSPHQTPGEYTEFYISAAEGNLTTDQPVTSEQIDVTLSVRNKEGTVMVYSIVILHERVTATGNELRITEARPLQTHHLKLADTESTTEEVAINVPPETINSRLTFLLFRGSVPASPSPDEAYRELHVWLSEPP